MLRTATLAALSAAALTSASIFSSSPDIDIRAALTPESQLNEVRNGVQNTLLLQITSHESSPYVLDFVTGAFREVGGKERALKNTTAAKYNVVLAPKASQPVAVPYHFYSQYKPQELHLSVWADVSPQEENAKSNRQKTAKKTYRLTAYEGQVSIVEPPISFFDPLLIFSYLTVLAALASGAYFLFPVVRGWFITERPAPRKRAHRAVRTDQVSSPTGSLATAPGPDGKTFEDEWIPEHHKKKPAKIPTGEPLSGSEAEGTDGSAKGGSGVGRTRRRKR